MRPSLPILTALLLASCGEPQLVERRHARECLGQPFSIRWFCDRGTDLALGIDEGDFKDANFGTRIHDADTGPTELSCFPDDVVFVTDGRGTARAYAGYLRWQHHLESADDGTRVRSVYRHEPAMGLLDRHIEPEFLTAMRGIEAELEVAHELERGRPWITTTVRFTNRAVETVRAHWLYQDGAHLHLPKPDQHDVTAVSSAGGGHFVQVDGGPTAWVGLADFDAGVCSVVHAPDAALCFVLPDYFGVRGSSLTAVGEVVQGVPCGLGGNDRFWVHAEELPLDLAAHPALGRAVARADLKIQGALFDLGELPPGATRAVVFHRFGVHGAETAPAVITGVAAMLRRIAARSTR